MIWNSMPFVRTLRTLLFLGREILSANQKWTKILALSFKSSNQINSICKAFRQYIRPHFSNIHEFMKKTQSCLDLHCVNPVIYLMTNCAVDKIVHFYLEFKISRRNCLPQTNWNSFHNWNLKQIPLRLFKSIWKRKNNSKYQAQQRLKDSKLKKNEKLWENKTEENSNPSTEIPVCRNISSIVENLKCRHGWTG